MTNNNSMSLYLSSIKRRFQIEKDLAEKTFDQLDNDDLFWQFNEESNSIAIIIQHLWGNMLSRWTDFLTSDGEKPWRQRDAEFESVIQTKAQLLEKCRQDGNACLTPSTWLLKKIYRKKFLFGASRIRYWMPSTGNWSMFPTMSGRS